MDQVAAVLSYLQTGKPLTERIAAAELHCSDLPHCIDVLRQRGITIHEMTVKDANAGVHMTMYELEGFRA